MPLYKIWTNLDLFKEKEYNQKLCYCYPEVMQVSMTVRAVLGIWLTSNKNSSPSLNPCYRGSLLLHPNLPDLSLSLVLASTRNPNINILCQRMPDLVLLPQMGAVRRRKGKKHKRFSRCRSRDGSRHSQSRSPRGRKAPHPLETLILPILEGNPDGGQSFVKTTFAHGS